MLASKKQEWSNCEYAPQIEIKRQQKLAPGLNIELRKKCCALAVLLLLLAGIATLQSERIISTGYQYVQLQKDLHEMEQKNEKLRVEIASLKSLERIQRIASSSLGMAAPKQVIEAPTASGTGRMASGQGQVTPRRKL